MKWTVVFLPTADEDLARIYYEAENKAEITHAAHQIDRLLQNDPDRKGQDYYGDRILHNMAPWRPHMNYVMTTCW